MIIKKFGLVPRGNVQCILEGDAICLIEVNPKFPASLAFTVAAGVNAPLLLVKMHLGEEIPPMIGRFRNGLIMLRCWHEVFIETLPAPSIAWPTVRNGRTQPNGEAGRIARLT
jgi:hypothetical protein